MDIFLNIVFGFFKENNAFASLLFLILLDITSGVLAAIGTKKLASDISFQGMTKKAFVLLIIAVCKLLESYSGGIPLAVPACIFYIITEIISITENAAKLGVPIPQGIIDVLDRLNRTTGVTTNKSGLIITSNVVVTDKAEVKAPLGVSQEEPAPAPVPAPAPTPESGS